LLAGGLYLLTRKTVHDPNLYKPAGEQPPAWWMRGILILTCTGVSFAHGTNDGQKSIGLIEVVSAVLIGSAGFTGLPVSTTHIVTSGIGGTMVASRAGLRYSILSRILIAWGLTLPVTILVAGGLYYLLANPQL
jgi:phosphate/sulfate permease